MMIKDVSFLFLKLHFHGLTPACYLIVKLRKQAAAGFVSKKIIHQGEKIIAGSASDFPAPRQPLVRLQDLLHHDISFLVNHGLQLFQVGCWIIQTVNVVYAKAAENSLLHQRANKFMPAIESGPVLHIETNKTVNGKKPPVIDDIVCLAPVAEPVKLTIDHILHKVFG